VIGTQLTAMKGDRCGTPLSFDILTPTLREAAARLAERARAENWSHEEYLAACLQREVSAREPHSGEGRIRAARFPARKSLEEFDFDHTRGLKPDTIAHLGNLDFVTAGDNAVFLGRRGLVNIAHFSYRLCRTVQLGRVLPEYAGLCGVRG
jgi:hypothetical protein